MTKLNKEEIPESWIQAAISGAKKASAAISKIYNGTFEVTIKSDNSPVTIADKTSSSIMVEALRQTNIPIISEEEEIPPYTIRSQYDYVWVIDPLDGTKEFIRKNDEFCICIALVNKNKAIFGLIAEPVNEKIILGGPNMQGYYFDFGVSDYKQKKYALPPLQINKQKSIAHSRSHFSTNTLLIIEKISSQYGEVNYIRKGSALKFVDLALGRADFYPRMAPTMEWDIAAGHAIYNSVGGEVLDFTNFEPLQYNKKNLLNPFFIAKNKDLTI